MNLLDITTQDFIDACKNKEYNIVWGKNYTIYLFCVRTENLYDYDIVGCITKEKDSYTIKTFYGLTTPTPSQLKKPDNLGSRVLQAGIYNGIWALKDSTMNPQLIQIGESSIHLENCRDGEYRCDRCPSVQIKPITKQIKTAISLAANSNEIQTIESYIDPQYSINFVSLQANKDSGKGHQSPILQKDFNSIIAECRRAVQKDITSFTYIVFNASDFA